MRHTEKNPGVIVREKRRNLETEKTGKTPRDRENPGRHLETEKKTGRDLETEKKREVKV